MSFARSNAAALGGIAGLLLWAALFWSGPLVNDVAWQLWIGRQINGGAALYGDILEVNPPLWFWIGAGFERLAATTGIAGERWLGLAFLAYATLSLLVTVRLLEQPRRQWAAALALVATLLLTSPYAHLQREQFLLMAVLPCLALAVRRAEGGEVSRGLALLVGLIAAPGLALKHHFLIFPALIEAWLWWRRRRFEIRPEHLSLVCAALLYAAAVMAFAPTYLSTMLPLLRAGYHGYNPSLWTLLFQPGIVVGLFALAAAGLGRGRLGVLGEAAAVGTAAFVLVFIVQGKDFHYQAIPALGMALLTMLALLLGKGSGGGRLVAAVGLAVALMVPVKAGMARYDVFFLQATRDLEPGEGVTLISPSQALAWPAVYERGLRWDSRTMGLWMVLSPWAAEKEGSRDSRMAVLGTAVRRELAAEIACKRPAMVIVDTFYDEEAPNRDVFGWLNAEPRFREALAGYREVAPVFVLRRFVPKGPTAAACVAGDLSAVTRPLP
ncbi:hypothetical protein GGQ97_001605 [Sphingomonas kaistensis]|uniref:Glycosyltransferase RgtA/B/C/D-like domain-containing protein n=1 Tax=Sphingomonas kaistensis TaxID=298708 RepID=A0A7X6BH77_9SPHN|nr:hypothetical protein [Sphingomonas kaistensis]NJC05812.1 hypothetical protein [Sphingomonas kaistensis]